MAGNMERRSKKGPFKSASSCPCTAIRPRPAPTVSRVTPGKGRHTFMHTREEDHRISSWTEKTELSSPPHEAEKVKRHPTSCLPPFFVTSLALSFPMLAFAMPHVLRLAALLVAAAISTEAAQRDLAWGADNRWVSCAAKGRITWAHHWERGPIPALPEFIEFVPMYWGMSAWSAGCEEDSSRTLRQAHATPPTDPCAWPR